MQNGVGAGLDGCLVREDERPGDLPDIMTEFSDRNKCQPVAVRAVPDRRV